MTFSRMTLVWLAAVAGLSACGGASSGTDAGTDAGLPAFDGGPGTLWLHLVGDSVIGLDTRDGRQVKRLDGIGADEGGDGVLALGGGRLWFQGANAVRGVDLASGVAADVPGSRPVYPAYGGGAVWWAEEGTLANPRPIFRYDVATQTTSNTNAAGIPNGTAGLIAAGDEGCFSLYMVLSDLSRGVAHVKPDGSALVSIPLPGAKNSLLGASVITGGGRGYAVTETMTETTRRLFAIDAATDTIVAQRDLSTPEFGEYNILALQDHLLFGEGALWYVDTNGGKFHELDPVTLATRRTVAATASAKQGGAVGAGAAWSTTNGGVLRTDLGTGAQVTIPVAGNIRAMVFQAP